MPQNGYWIECVPILAEDKPDGESETDLLYKAMIPAIPEAKVLAKSPDQAIQELRDKLASLRHEYCKQGKDLPAHDNPVKPPRNPKYTKGWISVYVNMADCCRNI